MSNPALKIDKVNVSYGAAQILRDVSLNVHYGEVLALVGPNGAGKSTLLGVLTADVTPRSGDVWLDERPLPRWKAAELSRVRAVLLQENAVAFSFTAAQVVEMGRAPWHGTAASAEDEAMMADAMRTCDVTHLAHRAYPSLSGGEKARVSLARVLAQQTPIVLLDEPTAALDLQHQEDVMRIARDLASQGRAVVVVLHDLSLAAAYADSMAILHRGEVAAIGTPEAVLTAETISDIYRTSVRILPDPDTGRPVVLPRR